MRRAVGLGLVLVLGLAGMAQAGADIFLTVGGAKVTSVVSPERVAIGNPDVADVKQISKDELLISGKTAGTTTLIIWSSDGSQDSSTVVVAAGKSAQTMIQVDVQVMEIVKTEGENLGVDWERMLGPKGQLTLKETTGPLNAIGSLQRGQLDLVLRLLAEKGNAKVLAKPKLMTLSGRKASFSSGGEIPVSTLNTSGGSNVEWKKYGVNLDVLPTAADNGTINAEIRAEVSEVDYSHLILGNPSIKTRWAATTIHVEPGSTLVIGGLIQDQDQISHQGIPVMMDLPVLGYLFKTTVILHSESELVIFVTPNLVGQ